MKRIACFVALLALASLPALIRAAEPVLKAGDRVAIVGDSITEQKLYSKYIEAYLLACSGVPDLKVFQYGWSGERADGFANRLENDLAGFQPTVVTLCYGMNDGGYQPYSDQVGRTYEANMRRILTALPKLGVRSIVVGSPGAVDQYFFRPGQKMGEQPAHVAYNDNLAHLRDIDKKLAAEAKQPFANVHDAMYQAMLKAQEKLGNKYSVCGGDGFHPKPNGQLIMAYAFLKGLGVDGRIGEIKIDLSEKKPSASPGHKAAAWNVENATYAADIESTRWPFCFEGDATSPDGTRSIVPFLPFNDDLNRLTLTVTGLSATKAKVQWGDAAKEFTKEQLAAGINLPAEFDATPFDKSFAQLVAAIGQKQAYETKLIKNVVTTFRNYPPEFRADPQFQADLKTLADHLLARQQALDVAGRKLLVPVKHTVKITPL